jgi:hypothetical protein
MTISDISFARDQKSSVHIARADDLAEVSLVTGLGPDDWAA